MDPDDDDRKFKTYGLDTTDGLKTIDGGSTGDGGVGAPADAHRPSRVDQSTPSGGAGWTVAMVISLVALIGVAAYFFIGGL